MPPADPDPDPGIHTDIDPDPGPDPYPAEAAPHRAAPPLQRIAILISGRGSNMVALARACAAERWPARIVVVLANRADAPGLTHARELGIAARAIEPRPGESRDAYDARLADALDAEAPDLVALAGYMRILSEPFVARYAGRLVNIHPSLLPAFAGLATHRRALAAGCKVTGATVHVVTAELDHGPIVAQAVVPVHAGDTVDALSARVLAAEHRLYPLALRWWVEGRLRLVDGRVEHVDGAPQWLDALD